MRRDVLDLRAFYANPLGEAARSAISRQVRLAWGEARGLAILGLGYATPFLARFMPTAERIAVAMPAGQGVELWPEGARNLACLADETALPFSAAQFDRALVVHALEECDAPDRLLAEATRVLKPNGRLIVVAVNRRSLWAGADGTPFGHGRPYTRRQLEMAIVHAGLQPRAWSRALYAPPWPAVAGLSDMIEQAGSRLQAPGAGLLLMEAEKQVFAVRPKARLARVVVPALRPATAFPAGSGARKSNPSSHETLAS